MTYDVLAVAIKTGRVRVLERGTSLQNAEAFMNMAVIRRCVDEEFSVVVEAGSHHDGDIWVGHHTCEVYRA